MASLYLIMAGLGCFATLSQVILVREYLSVFAGHELCLGIIFATWFVGITIGAAAGGRLSNRFGTSPTIFLLASGCMLLSLPACLTVLRFWRGIFELPAGVLPGLGMLLLSGFLLIVPFCFFIGLSFPFMCRLVSDKTINPHKRSLSIGKVYLIESAGAVVGGCAVSLVLVGRFGSFESVALAGCPLLIGLAWLSFQAIPSRLFMCSGAFFSICACCLLGLFLGGNIFAWDEKTSEIRFKHLGAFGRRVAFADTAYQHMDLAEQGGQYTLVADGKLVATFPDSYAWPLRAHLIMTQHPKPSRVLMLGHASVQLLPSTLLHPAQHIDLVELDPGVRRLTEPFLQADVQHALNDSRVSFHLTDGRRFLNTTRQSWDVIYSQAPDPYTVALNRFYTLEFFKLVGSRLKPGGVFITRLSSSANLLDRDTASLVRTVQATMKKSFTHVEVLPGQETFLLASQEEGVLLTDPDQLANRYRSRKIKDTLFTHHHFKVLFQTELVEDLQMQLKQRGQAFLNTDARPVTHLQSILRWSTLSDDAAAKPLRFLAGLPSWLWFVLVFIGLVLATFLVYQLKSGPEPGDTALQRANYLASLLAVFLVGTLGLSLELIISFAYQAYCGSLYRELGLIVAAFMAGLVIGAVLIYQKLGSRPGSNRFLGMILLVLAAFSAALPTFLSSNLLNSIPMWAGQALLLCMVLASGTGTGLVFPLCSQIAVSSDHPISRAAGTLDALDHLGAAIGALMIGVVLLPTLGQHLTCYLLAFATALTGIINLAIGSRR